MTTATRKRATTFDEWWEANYADRNIEGADRGFGETVWNAAQEAVLMPLLSAADDKEDEN